MNPAICTGAGGAFSVVLASPVFVGSNMVLRLVIVAGSVSSDPSGDSGSGVPGLAALNSCKMFCSPSIKVLVLISSSVRSMSPAWSAVLPVC